MEIEANGTYDLITNGVQRVPVTINVSSGELEDKTINIYANNIQNDYDPEEGYIGFSRVRVNVSITEDLYLMDVVGGDSEQIIPISANGSDVSVVSGTIILYNLVNSPNVIHCRRYNTATSISGVYKYFLKTGVINAVRFMDIDGYFVISASVNTANMYECFTVENDSKTIVCSAFRDN